LNWGSSYLVNDFYRRFLRTAASEAHYVAVSRVATVIIVLLSAVVTYFMNRITSGWELVLTLGAGTGLVYILRWYWWRVNAWSEIAAMSAALVVSLGLRWLGTFDSASPIGFAQTILTTVAITTAVWLIATFVTAPEPDAKLAAFYRRVRPAGPGWTGVAALAGAAQGLAAERLAPGFVNWILGIAAVYTTLFAVGEILFGAWLMATLFGSVALASAITLGRRLESA
jgi:hypothetical protein